MSAARPVTKRLVALTVNGERHEVAIAEHATLLEVLREELGLTGTKHGCEAGECGVCTLLVDGVPWLACLTLAVEAEGKEVTTVEGLAAAGRPGYLQAAFAELGAAQCGYCTPGIQASARALLDANPAPTEAEVRQALAGNLCRCTGYGKIIEAVLLAAERARGDGDGN